MIWIKKENNYEGYIPILNSSFSNEQINEYSKYAGYNGWSDLSKLIMETMGISYNPIFPRKKPTNNIIKELEDINFTFDFECLYLRNNDTNKYCKQLLEVLPKFYFCKIKEFTEEELNQIYINICSSHLLTKNTKKEILEDIYNIKERAKETYINFKKINKLFKLYGLDLNNQFIISNKYIEDFKKERSILINEEKRYCKKMISKG